MASKGDGADRFLAFFDSLLHFIQADLITDKLN